MSETGDEIPGKPREPAFFGQLRALVAKLIFIAA
jgi:hypothetical protein